MHEDMDLMCKNIAAVWILSMAETQQEWDKHKGIEEIKCPFRLLEANVIDKIFFIISSAE